MTGSLLFLRRNQFGSCGKKGKYYGMQILDRLSGKKIVDHQSLRLLDMHLRSGRVNMDALGGDLRRGSFGL